MVTRLVILDFWRFLKNKTKMSILQNPFQLPPKLYKKIIKNWRKKTNEKKSFIFPGTKLYLANSSDRIRICHGLWISCSTMTIRTPQQKRKKKVKKSTKSCDYFIFSIEKKYPENIKKYNIFSKIKRKCFRFMEEQKNYMVSKPAVDVQNRKIFNKLNFFYFVLTILIQNKQHSPSTQNYIEYFETDCHFRV